MEEATEIGTPWDRLIVFAMVVPFFFQLYIFILFSITACIFLVTEFGGMFNPVISLSVSILPKLSVVAKWK